MGEYSPDQGDDLVEKYSLTDSDIDRIFTNYDLLGSRGISPGGQ